MKFRNNTAPPPPADGLADVVACRMLIDVHGGLDTCDGFRFGVKRGEIYPFPAATARRYESAGIAAIIDVEGATDRERIARRSASARIEQERAEATFQRAIAQVFPDSAVDGR